MECWEAFYGGSAALQRGQIRPARVPTWVLATRAATDICLTGLSLASSAREARKTGGIATVPKRKLTAQGIASYRCQHGSLPWAPPLHDESRVCVLRALGRAPRP